MAPFDITKEIPEDLSGKVYVVTGANAGLGLKVTEALASRGAHVIMACRSEKRATVAMEEIKSDLHEANLTYLPYDQSSVESITGFVDTLKETVEKVDCLVNNAGLGGKRKYETAEGLEFVIGVNHFGCYALTVALINSGLLDKAENPRIVITSSELHRFPSNPSNFLTKLSNSKGKFNGSDQTAYNISKLFNLLFAFKLDEELKAKGRNIVVVTTHPGLTVTKLNNSSCIVRQIGMNLDKGCLSSIYCAASEAVESGTYIGPGGCLKISGYPAVTRPSATSHDVEAQDKLWKLSEELTGQVLSL